MKSKIVLLTLLCLLIGCATKVTHEKPTPRSPYPYSKVVMTREKTTETSSYTYSVVDLRNGLTCALFEIGTTSFVFRVEWSRGMKFPANALDVMFNLGLDPVYWAPIIWDMPVIAEQGWLEFQVPFSAFHLHKGGVPPQVGFFSVRPSYVYEKEEEGYIRSNWDWEDDGEPPVIPWLASQIFTNVTVELFSSDGSLARTNTFASGNPCCLTICTSIDKSLLENNHTNVVYSWKVLAPEGKTYSGSLDLQQIRETLTPETNLAYYPLVSSLWVDMPAYQPLFTREEIIQPEPIYPNTKDWDRSRLYAEVDLTGDGSKDIIISSPEYQRSARGLFWFIYLCVGPNQYKRAGIAFGWSLAIEEVEGDDFKRIWGYKDINSQEGEVTCSTFKDGKYENSVRRFIYIKDGVPTTGGDTHNAIFDGKCLEFERIFPEITPGNTSTGGGRDG